MRAPHVSTRKTVRTSAPTKTAQRVGFDSGRMTPAGDGKTSVVFTGLLHRGHLRRQAVTGPSRERAGRVLCPPVSGPPDLAETKNTPGWVPACDRPPMSVGAGQGVGVRLFPRDAAGRLPTLRRAVARPHSRPKRNGFEPLHQGHAASLGSPCRDGRDPCSWERRPIDSAVRAAKAQGSTWFRARQR